MAENVRARPIYIPTGYTSASISIQEKWRLPGLGWELVRQIGGRLGSAFGIRKLSLQLKRGRRRRMR
ncbi:hypothetical protein Pyn_18289 [Prunus yedoensis var. nudiflora]|uniref:Uncharacterized protein n=1 Tax=Prunus yedoensis var. nudiflora TaxID=2094558 RepID=A0A314V174_PRUYE|nr:hypothetical protein Pyn_18289 [Prunus yedoensis var. nudiflora]